MGFDNEVVLKVLLSLCVGGIIGAERELRSKSAGFRTLMLICLGATLFTIFSELIGARNSPERIASNIVVGIGFLGAGVIFRGDNSRVNGITTAAAIWITAAMGMGIGAGYYFVSLTACIAVFIILFLFSRVDQYLDRVNQVRNYKIVYPYEENNQNKYERMLVFCNLKVKSRAQSKVGNIISGTWVVQGKESNHHKFIEHILKDSTVNQFDF